VKNLGPLRVNFVKDLGLAANRRFFAEFTLSVAEGLRMTSQVISDNVYCIVAF